MAGLVYSPVACLVLMPLCLTLPLAAGDPNLPRIDQCRVVYVCEPDTKFVQLSDGTVCIENEEEIFSDSAREYYRGLPRPFDARRLRDFPKDLNGRNPDRFQGVDAKGRAWFANYHDPKRGQRAACIEDRTCKWLSFGRSYHYGPDPSSPAIGWPWKGQDILCDRQGRIWLVTIKGLRQLGARLDDKPTEIPFPTPKDPQDVADCIPDREGMPCLGHQIYSLGDSVWVVRSTNSNCSKAGTFIVRFVGGQSTIMARLLSRYVNGMLSHRGDVYAFIEASAKHDQFAPSHILRFHVAGAAAQPAELIGRKIKELDEDSWKVRDAATRWLCELPPGQMGLLTEALKKPASKEQEVRLEVVIEAIRSRSTQGTTDTLEGLSRGRLKFIDRGGRQFVQAWSDTGPEARMIVLDGNSSVSVPLPSADFKIGCQDADGTMYASDKKCIYTLSPKLEIKPIVSLDNLGGLDVPVYAAQKGLLCVGLPSAEKSNPVFRPVWLDLKAKPAGPLLPGKSVAEGVAMTSNRSKFYHVAVGPGDALWLVRCEMTKDQTGKEFASTQLLRAFGEKVEQLSEKLDTDFVRSVWPLGQDTAVVATRGEGWKQKGVIWYHAGQAQVYTSLKELVEARHEVMAKTMPDPAAFMSGEHYDEVWLIRAGESFYVEDSIYVETPNSSGTVERSLLMRKGQWVEQRERGFGDEKYEPLLCRMVGLDARSKRVLAFQDSYKTLRWLDLAGGGASRDILGLKTAWAWRMFNKTHLPRFDGSWTLTPEAARRLVAINDEYVKAAAKRGVELDEDDIEYKSEDLPAFRRWDGGKWRTINHSLVGASVFEDAAGGVWQFESRRATVTFADGREQAIPLDAGHAEDFRLAVESPDAVWVASLESLWRMSLVRDAAGKPWRWEVSRRFRLPRCGLDFAGPWIAGSSMYYLSHGTLYHVALRDVR